MGPDQWSSRHEFVADLSLLGLAPVVTPLRSALPGPAGPRDHRRVGGEWDLSWIRRIEAASDRAVFDWATMGDPGDPIVLQIADRYFGNCAVIYGADAARPSVVLNIRTTATAAALTDEAWDQYGLGTDTGAIDPDTKAPARRNPFWRRAAAAPAGMPDLAGLLERGAIALVCDFALGHLARRVGTRIGRAPAPVHEELRGRLVPGGFLVPSGIFGLARAQNAGCAFVRM